jgi:nucleoside-diphosphate-sugar epimerase
MKKIFIIGHREMVGSAIVRQLQLQLQLQLRGDAEHIFVLAQS